MFDQKTYLAKLGTPRPAEFSKVVINPQVAFGRPTVEGSQVPTSVLFGHWKAEQSKDRVAEWFAFPRKLSLPRLSIGWKPLENSR